MLTQFRFESYAQAKKTKRAVSLSRLKNIEKKLEKTNLTSKFDKK